MKESSVYQAALKEGKAEGVLEGVRETLLLLGEAHFGPPDAPAIAALNAIMDHHQLQQLILRMEQVSGWQELLGIEGRRGNGKRRRRN